jgi:ATP synthase protein I
MTERKPPEPRNNLDERLRRFRSERDVATGRTSRPASMHSGLGFAMRIGVELVAALIVGVGIGYLLDNWLNTTPLISLLGFFFGAAAGFLNVYRVATGKGSTVGYRKQSEDGETPDRDRDMNEG